MATIRLMAMISLMTFYIIEAKSQNILIAIRSIWFSSGLNIYWIDKFILFFEMTIRIDDLTKEVALIVTDFFEGEEEEEELRLLWDNNIHKLKQAIGG